MGKIDKGVAKKEVEDWIGTLGIREHKLEKIKDHKKELINLVAAGVVRFDGDKVAYLLETPFEDGSKEIFMVKKRYTVSEMHDMQSDIQGDDVETALTLIGMMCEPIISEGYMGTLKGDFTDLNAISAFFLPI